jgi:hypothetical protein
MPRTSALLAALGLLLASSAIAQDSVARDAKDAESPSAKPLPPRPVGIAPT